MDGVWMLSMAFSLPLARAEKRLSSRRPTSSLLGMNTMSTVLGVLFINFCFTCIALGTLTVQDWYQCRKWGSTDISNITLIGDNYEVRGLHTLLASLFSVWLTRRFFRLLFCLLLRKPIRVFCNGFQLGFLISVCMVEKLCLCCTLHRLHCDPLDGYASP